VNQVNIAASVRARPLNRARETRQDFNLALIASKKSVRSTPLVAGKCEGQTRDCLMTHNQAAVG